MGIRLLPRSSRGTARHHEGERGCVIRELTQQAAAQAMIEQWFVPTIKPRPGHLVSSCYKDNMASRFVFMIRLIY